MRDYWQSLTSRERFLVGTAIVLAALTLAYFAVFRPLSDFSDESKRALNAARNTFERVQMRAAELKTISENETRASAPGSEQASLRVSVSNAARQAGVAISRLQPSDDGTLTIWAENVQSAQLFRWLQALAVDRGVGPANVLVQKSASGENLRVQLRFEDVTS